MIDTHAHLANPQLAQQIEHYLQLAQESGVEGILCVATSAEDSFKCVELAERFPMIRAAVGIHPNNCHQAAEGDWLQIQQLARHPQVVALGETGLDRYWDDCPWELQVEYLKRHILLSREMNRPIVIHTRDCVDEAIDLLAAEYAHGPYSAVMHSFTGSSAAAQRCLELGFYISFAGMLTFKNGQEIRSVARCIPLDRVLVETDSPYLTPHPLRGQRPNHPALCRHTLECLAELRGEKPERLSAVVTENSLRLFQSWKQSS